MKYAILTYERRPMRPNGKNRLNIGDPIQVYAMNYLYGLMGINESDLIKISRYDAKNYDGEYAILPFNCFNRIYNQLGRPYATLPLSPKIIPVFTSFHLHSRCIDDAILNNLRAYQPVGCRDEETMINMRNHGIIAYLSGCVTALLPRRTVEPKKEKTFFIDVPESVLEFVPKELKDNAEYKTHHILLSRSSNADRITDEEYERFNQLAIEQLEQYKNEATLVVTSRLHAATPCMAMGIPVILVSENFDGRFSGIDKFLPLYTPDQFYRINWKPEIVEYEQDKKQMINIFVKQMIHAYEKNNDIYNISSFYENRMRTQYNKGILESLSNLPISENKNIKYGVWGLVSNAQILKNIILDYYESWLFEAAIDKTSDGTFEGLTVTKPEDIQFQDENIVYFILPKAAHEQAYNLLTQLGRSFVLVEGTQMKYFE